MRYEARGGVESLFYSDSKEILLEGPAGTGKTRGVCEYIRMRCSRHKGLKVLFLRKTLKSLRQTVLPIWEDEVLGPGHPAIYGTATREHREGYKFPGTDAEVILGGLDDVDKYMSGAFDIIVIFEATDNRDETKHARLTTRLRAFNMSFQQLICECNPKERPHYLNRRANRKDKHGRPVMRRLHSRHRDNARYFRRDGTPTREGAYYMETLENLPEIEKRRLLHGEWITATGLILSNYDPERHEVRGFLEWGEDGPVWDDENKATLHLDYGCRGPQGNRTVKLRWFLGGQDWGAREPGCFQVWGFDDDRNAFRVAEIYKRGENLDWWAESVLPLIKRFRIKHVFADHADGGTGAIGMMNDRLGRYMDRDGRRVYTKANKDWQTGVDLLQWGLGVNEAEQRMWLLQPSLDELEHPSCRSIGSLIDADSELAERGVWCFEHEAASWVYRELREGRLPDEEADPGCPDHAIDTARYSLQGAWRRDEYKAPPPPQYDPRSMYYISGEDKIDREEERARKAAQRRVRQANARVRARKRRAERMEAFD